MEKDKAGKIANLFYEIEVVSKTIHVQKDSNLNIENGTLSPLVAEPKSPIHEALMVGLENQKSKLEKELEAIN